jgi:hypothetical protein
MPKGWDEIWKEKEDIKQKAIFGQECNDDSCANCKWWLLWDGCKHLDHPFAGEHPCSDWEKK